MKRILVSILVLLTSTLEATWTQLVAESLPGNRFGSRTVDCEEFDQMILFGGGDSSTNYNDLYSFNFTSNIWFPISLLTAQLPPVRTSFIFSKISESAEECDMVLTGGNGLSSIYLDDVWLLRVFSNLTSLWQIVNTSTSANLPPTRMASNAVSLSPNSLYLFGGSRQLLESYNDLWHLHVNVTALTALWKQIPSTAVNWPLARHAHAMTGLGPDALLIHGGRRYLTMAEKQALGNNANYVVASDVAVFNTTEMQWTLLPEDYTLDIARSSHATFVHRNRLFSFGGFSYGKVSTYEFNDILVAYTNLSSVCQSESTAPHLWCLAAVADETRPTTRFEFSFVQRHDQLVVYGGSTFQVTEASNQRISFEDVWSFNLNALVVGGVALPPQSTNSGTSMESTIYFMISVLFLLLGLFVLFMLNLRRRAILFNRRSQSNGTRYFVPVLVPAPGQVGATQAVIDALPLKPFLKRDQDVEENDHSLCAICLVDYAEGDMVRELPCLHQFHPQCIDQWLIKHNACPMCKRQVGETPALPRTSLLELSPSEQVLVSAENPSFEPFAMAAEGQNPSTQQQQHPQQQQHQAEASV